MLEKTFILKMDAPIFLLWKKCIFKEKVNGPINAKSIENRK